MDTLNPSAAEPAYLTPSQVAQRFAVSDDTVRRWIAEGRLRAIKIERTTRILIASVAEFERAYACDAD